MINVNEILPVIDTNEASALSLSKGGWEGWLQCELWSYLGFVKQLTVEREVPYPNEVGKRCDLVVRDLDDATKDQWIELKAYGVFRENDADRFMDQIAVDVDKLHDRPEGTYGMVAVVVSKAFAGDFSNEFHQRGWNGFATVEGQYAVIFYINY